MDGRLHNGSVISFRLEELPGAESTQAGEIILQFAGFELSDCIARHGETRPSSLEDMAILGTDLSTTSATSAAGSSLADLTTKPPCSTA